MKGSSRRGQEFLPVSPLVQRRLLLDLLAAALGAVKGRERVRDRLARRRPTGAVYAVAVGKAAVSMMEGALDAWGEAIVQGLVITKRAHVPAGVFRDAPIRCLEAGHPEPDEGSLAAGAALLDFIGQIPAQAQCVFLISGGASSLVEVLPEGVGLDDWRRANRWLLASGWPIGRVNAVRKALSCIKGGRLARCLGGRQTLALLISDVPGDDPAVIGSGLLVADEPISRDVAAVPAWLAELLDAAPVPPLPGDPVFASLELEIIARLEDAKQAAADAARAQGLPVQVYDVFLAGEAAECGKELAHALLSAPPGIHVWGGETTVTLPPAPGRGGCNQQLALAAATVLAGRYGVALLAVGSDGTDGPTEDAGALVDGGSVARGEEAGWREDKCLAGADAGRFLEASGDLIQTGPTGTNVMDIVIGIKSAELKRD